MKRITQLLALFQSANSLTYWFTVEASPSKMVYSAAMAGANGEFLVQGKSAN